MDDSAKGPFAEFTPGAENTQDAETPPPDLIGEVAALAALPPLEYERRRESAAKLLSIRVSALDKAVALQRTGIARGDEDQDAAITDPELWVDHVDGAALADHIKGELCRYVIFASEEHANAATLWILGTYSMDVWSLWPKVLISSPSKQCGKSTLLETLEAFCCRALIVSNIRAAGLFRVIEAWRPCLLIDEADRFLSQDDEANGIINAGHRRRTATVIRVEEKGGEYVPRRFSVWGAQAIAGIGRQADTLADRSVRIGLRRSLLSDKVSKLPATYFESQIDARRMAARWAADSAISLAASDIEPASMGNDRSQDNWTPLYRIAAALGGAWPDEAANAYAAMEPVETEAEDENPGIMLLRDMSEVFYASDRLKAIGSVALCDARSRWRSPLGGNGGAATQSLRAA